MKSQETSGASHTSRMPLSDPLAAFLNASFTSAGVVAFSTWTIRLTDDTSAVGTRSDIPSIFPLTSGITSAVAFAAPVVVGMMLRPAARARRGSLWATSRIRWSFVYEWIVFM